MMETNTENCARCCFNVQKIAGQNIMVNIKRYRLRSRSRSAFSKLRTDGGKKVNSSRPVLSIILDISLTFIKQQNRIIQKSDLQMPVQQSAVAPLFIYKLIEMSDLKQNSQLRLPFRQRERLESRLCWPGFSDGTGIEGGWAGG